MKKLIVGFLALDFLALNIVVFAMSGATGFEAFIADFNLWSLLITTDLVIALGLAMVWMWNDAKQHGMSALPYIVLTALTGSLGPLLYLLRRPSRETTTSANLPRQPLRA